MNPLAGIALAMLAFSANSLLARLALSETSTDPASFTAIRLVSGALALYLFVLFTRGSRRSDSGSWISAAALFAYAGAFSFAYVSLSAGSGALILFGAVQATMLTWGFVHGDRFNRLQWLGFVIASAGVVALAAPGASAPSFNGGVLMAVAGFAWGVYSIRGGTGDPVETSAYNFVRAAPLAALLALVFLDSLRVDVAGVSYALASGVLASAAGYIVWYSVLSRINLTTAATVQLGVPAITALLAVVLLSEPITWRLVLSGVAMLGGIAVVIRYKR